MATDPAVTSLPSPKASTLLDDAFRRLRIPPTGQRVALGVLVFLGIYIGVVGLPTYAIQLLQANNLPVNVSTTTVMLYGGALAVLGAAAYAVRPYRAYGPVAMACDGAKLLYLWILYLASPFSFNFTGGSTGFGIGIGYTAIVLILMLSVLFTLASDAVTTYEDLSHPAERLYWTYPAR